MPSAKPVYDTDGHWKHRQFNPAEWSALTERLQRDLKPFYPDQQADACPEFGDPVDAWVNALLAEAYRPRTTDALRPYLERIEAHILQQAGVTFDVKAEPGKLRVVTG